MPGDVPSSGDLTSSPDSQKDIGAPITLDAETGDTAKDLGPTPTPDVAGAVHSGG